MSVLERNASRMMSPTPQQFLSGVIEPVLCHLDSNGHHRAASQLLLATALHESSGLRYRRQQGGGPARSYYQIELATHDDIWQSYLRYRPSLSHSVRSLLGRPDADLTTEFEFNDAYATAIARLHYLSVADPIPAFGDLDAMASYWKRHYNMGYGKCTARQFLADWRYYTGGTALIYRKYVE